MSFKVRALHKRAFSKPNSTTVETVPVYNDDDYDIEYTVDDNTGDILEQKVLKEGAKPKGMTTTVSNSTVQTSAPRPARQHASLSMRKVSAESFM